MARQPNSRVVHILGRGVWVMTVVITKRYQIFLRDEKFIARIAERAATDTTRCRSAAR